MRTNTHEEFEASEYSIECAEQDVRRRQPKSSQRMTEEMSHDPIYNVKSCPEHLLEANFMRTCISALRQTRACSTRITEYVR